MSGATATRLATALALTVALADRSAAAIVGGMVTIDGKPAGNAVIALRSGRPLPPASQPPRAVMDQKHLAFQPAVLPVVRGTVVEFTNNDDVEHNVFSPSEIAGRFDLGTYRNGQSRDVRLDTTGEVRVLCNIHMEMEANILVLDEPWAAVTRADGSFEIPAVPAGDYELTVWSDGWLPTKQALTVPETGSIRVDVAATR